MKRKQHWENVYETTSDQDVGWFQENPETSLRLIEKYSAKKELPIIDIGGGNSHLSRILFELGYSNLSVLDISLKALKRSKSRFNGDVEKITWIEADVLRFSTKQFFQIWHDRAVFHFLLEESEIRKYAEVAANSIKQDGYLILGAFSLSGPKTCSGLQITQYCEEHFCNVFLNNFELIECFEDVHTTPSGNPQNFIWVVFKKVRSVTVLKTKS